MAAKFHENLATDFSMIKFHMYCDGEHNILEHTHTHTIYIYKFSHEVPLLTKPTPALSLIYTASWYRSSSRALYREIHTRSVIHRDGNHRNTQKRKALNSYIELANRSANDVVRRSCRDRRFQPRGIFESLGPNQLFKLRLLFENPIKIDQKKNKIVKLVIEKSLIHSVKERKARPLTRRPISPGPRPRRSGATTGPSSSRA